MCSRYGPERSHAPISNNPHRPDFFIAEIIAPDASAVLNMVSRLECRAADVDQDGEYSFSVRISVAGLWRIFDREDEARNPSVSLLG